MDIYGIVGKKLGHTFSPAYFNEKFKVLNLNADYLKFEFEDISGFRNFILSQKRLIGLNITVPFKESIIPYLDKLSPVAEKIGAVNTIVVKKAAGEIKLVGYNTDAEGFQLAIAPFISDKLKLNALILGTGGSSKAIAYVLQQLGIQHQFVSRYPKNQYLTYGSLNEEIINKHLLVINTTPLGMDPDIDKLPEIPYQFLTNNHLLFDLIYNPEQTTFMKNGRKRGARVENGMKMLYFQAEASWRIWQGMAF